MRFNKVFNLRTGILKQVKARCARWSVSVLICLLLCKLCLWAYIYMYVVCTPNTPFRLVKDWPNDTENSSLSARLKFQLWDDYNKPRFGKEAGNGTHGLFVYRCDDDSMSYCGGWVDRLKGILVAYLIANLTGRAFHIDMPALKCEIELYLKPNKINWSKKDNHHIRSKGVQTFKYVDKRCFLDCAHELNFSQHFGQEKFVYFQGNLDYVTRLRENKIYKNELSWMQRKSPSDVYAALYKHIFKLSPHLQSTLDKLLKQYLPTSSHRLICAQVRLGRNPTIPKDSQYRFSSSNLGVVWEFLTRKASRKKDTIFLMSDSEDVIKAAQQQSFIDKLLTIPGDILHVDKASNSSMGAHCSGFERMITEFHLFANCDVMLQGHSGLSQLASFLRGSDRNLFCLFDNGSITPCIRDLNPWWQ